MTDEPGYFARAAARRRNGELELLVAPLRRCVRNPM